MDETGFRLLSQADVDPAAEVISQAFMDDPLCSFMLPKKRSRLGTLYKFFHAYGQLYIQNKRGFGVGEPLKGVAFWLEPSHADVSVSLRGLSVFLPLLFTPYPKGYIRARSIIQQTDLMHKKYAPGPHYYLDNLGVLPSEQGTGISSHLMRPILEKADVESVDVYTDTATAKNVPYYEHFGFQVMQEVSVLKTGVTIWALLRSSKRS
jgi:ribosomal protein S18 acetylase RimI-like enzyme